MSEPKVFDINLPFDNYVYMKFVNNSKPENIKIDYISNDSLDIYLNNSLVNELPTVKDSISIDSNLVFPYFSVKIDSLLKNGENSLIFHLPSDTTNNYFGAHIILEFDKRKLEKNNIDTNEKKR